MEKIEYCGKCGKRKTPYDTGEPRPTHEDLCTCNDTPTLMGWTCPVCGRGVSPFMAYCDCKQQWNGLYPIPMPTPYCNSETH